MKNFYKTLFIFSSPLLGDVAFSQTAPGIEWQNTIGGSLYERVYSIIQTSDGGYFLGGTSSSDISGDKTQNCFGMNDYWVLKLNISGNVEWDKTFGGDEDDELWSVIESSNGGYVLCGYSFSDSSGNKTVNAIGDIDGWVLKLDNAGNLQWQNNFSLGPGTNCYLTSVQESVDGGYVAAGYTDKLNYWIIKIDSLGNEVWNRIVIENSHATLYSFDQTNDWGYVLGGHSDGDVWGDKTEPCQGGYDYWVVKLDSLRNIQWQNTIGGNLADYLFSIQQTFDGGYILGGWAESNLSGDKTETTIGLTDYWIIKLNSIGNIQWQNTIQASNTDYCYYISQTSDSGYVLCGHTQSDAGYDKTQNLVGGDDYWVLKLNAYGSIQWQKNIGGSIHDDGAISIFQTNDGGYIFGGWSSSSISGDKTENCIGGYDFWIVKLAPDTITGITDSPPQADQGFVISPNPLTSYSTITFSNPAKEKFVFTLYDITGRALECVSTTTDKIIIEKGSMPPGVYLFNLVNEKTGEKVNGKIIIQ